MERQLDTSSQAPERHCVTRDLSSDSSVCRAQTPPSPNFRDVHRFAALVQTPVWSFGWLIRRDEAVCRPPPSGCGCSACREKTQTP